MRIKALVIIATISVQIFCQLPQQTLAITQDNQRVGRGDVDDMTGGEAQLRDDEVGGEVGGAERYYVEPPLPSDPGTAALLQAITAGRPLEEVRAGAGMTPREMRTRLAQLEGDGWIRSVGLGGYARVGKTPVN